MTSLPFDYVSESYGYLWGWPSRAESAGSIAARLQQMVRLLSEAEPAYGDLWPFGVRRSNPGPVLNLDPEDLALLIDQRARFDPPRRPAPVSEEGYHLSLANDRRGHDPLFARLYVDAGRYGDGGRNAVEFHVQPNGPGWQNEGLMQRVLEGMVTVWDARWAAVWHRWADEERVYQRPRLAWSAQPLASYPVPSYLRRYPFPFPFEQAPTTRVYHARLGGELEEWGEGVGETD